MAVTLEEAYNGGLREFVIDVPDASGRPTRERIEVKIPPGVRDGTRLRVAGKGHPGFNDGPRGDLYLRIRLSPHERLERRGDDLHADVPVPLLDAILGGEVEMQTLSGRGHVPHPAGDAEREDLPPRRAGDAQDGRRGQGRLLRPGQGGAAGQADATASATCSRS